MLEAAVELAERLGFSSFTMRDVAVAAGVSLGTLQYFYPSKDELVRAVALELADQVVQVAGQLPPGATDMRGVAGLDNLLTQAVESWWGIISSTPTRRLVTYEIATNGIRGGGPILDTALLQYRLNTAYITAMLVTCAEVARVNWAIDVDELGLFAMNFMDGYVLRWLLEPEASPASAQRRTLVKAIVAFAVEGDAT
ncbi:TetR/AcrR family transcriptional regulator [Gordonia defluvii]|uniref:TetR/AcrR family transcriptional regulator n=1 Tax=Gordonia defluvii TaxID=283718 RepID=A0ABN3Y7S5_9ACTN|nr:TetR/AcrR family transcriptional regulator [Gordonia sp. UBA5067]